MARKTVSEEQRIAAERQLVEKQSEIHFDVRDFTVKYLVDQFRAGVFYIPEYQRGFVWNNRNRNRFIESMLLGLPIPFMFAADMTDGSLEIVDGAQRIQTLEQFLAGDLRLSGLEQLPALEGFVFTDLPGPQARRLENRPMRMIFLEAATTDAIRHEIFSRINTSGERARGSEVRRGAYSGAFMQFVTECASDPLFLKLCPISDAMRNRREGEELVLRFFAYSDEYVNFKHDVDRFLDDFVKRHRETFDRLRLRNEFGRMLAFVDAHFPRHGFAKADGARMTPRVRFEAISVGVNLALRERPSLGRPNLDWLNSAEFASHTTTHSSNSLPRLRGRIEFVRDHLLAV